MRRPSRTATPRPRLEERRRWLAEDPGPMPGRQQIDPDPMDAECGKCGWVGEVLTLGADCPECDHRTHPKRG